MIMTHAIYLSAFFIGIQGIIAFILSYIVVMERVKLRLWHGESQEDVALQPDPLVNPNFLAKTVENLTTKILANSPAEPGALQRKIRAHANFTEYVPLGLFFIIVLDLMQAPAGLVGLLGGSLTIARIAHAWGLIKTYGPSPGRAIGFFLTWFVYLVGTVACIYYGLKPLL